MKAVTNREERMQIRLESDTLDPAFMTEEVRNLLQTLQHHNHTAYIVGGCVRDWFLGYDREEFLAKDGDFDITTSATMEEMKEIFSTDKLILDGQEFGTVKIYRRGEIYELTTFRIEGAYRDGRHPEEVIFSDKVEDDLSRRDFTINAIAADLKGQVIDPYRGRADVKQGIVRTVGNPHDRFDEDYLRMVRAVRFSASLQFTMDPATLQAIQSIMQRDIGLLQAVSTERLLVELQKMLGPWARIAVDLLYETSLLPVIIPFLPVPRRDEVVATIKTRLYDASEYWYVNLAQILVTSTGDSASGNEYINQVEEFLVSLAMGRPEREHILNLVNFFPLDEALRLLTSSEAEQIFHVQQWYGAYKTQGGYWDDFLSHLEELHIMAGLDIHPQFLATMQDLARTKGNPSEIPIHLDGRDVKQLGFQGRQIGLVIEELRQAQPSTEEHSRNIIEKISQQELPVDHEDIARQLNAKSGEVVVKATVKRRTELYRLLDQHT